MTRGREALPAVHRELLERYRHAANLIGPGPAAEHFDDIAAAADLPLDGHWFDLGSGAGFPGLVLAAQHPRTTWTLVEPRERRAAFLEEVVLHARAPGIEVLRARHEDLADAIVDGVTSRALTAPSAFLDVAARLLKPGGAALLFLQDREPPAHPAFSVDTVRRYDLAGHAPRRLALLRRSGGDPQPA